MIRNLFYLFTDKIVSRVADARVGVPVVGRMSGAGYTYSTDSDVSQFTETTVFEEIFVSSTIWWDEGVTTEGNSVVDFIHSTLPAFVGDGDNLYVSGYIGGGDRDPDQDVALSTNTSLFVTIIDFIDFACNKDAGAVYEGEASTASTSIELWEIGLIGWASLADILDDYETRKASADSVDELLVKAAGVNTYTLHTNGIVLRTFWAFTTEAVNRHVALFTVTIEGNTVKDLVRSAAVAHGFEASIDFDSSWFATGAIVVVVAVAIVVGEGSYC